MAGEDSQDTGRDGLQRAKQWLDLSTRVLQSWAYDDPTLAEMVHFAWPYASGPAKPFSFDLGGKFRGDSLDGQSFLAEVKNYRYEMDLAEHFRDFLAKCYVALGDHPRRCGNFLWISWAPFQAQQWHKHATTEKVRSSLLHKANRVRALGEDDEAEAAKKLDVERMAAVASRVWLITLGDRQERLVLTEEHFYQIAEMLARERGVGA
ncbi:MAG TPA: hypothetical protein VMA72_14170 [Streptosporangiaceae bacterium]|nr:hypothetical protein [Streptosporangiaceae bacterium]